MHRPTGLVSDVQERHQEWRHLDDDEGFGLPPNLVSDHGRKRHQQTLQTVDLDNRYRLRRSWPGTNDDWTE
jgi:hypothetical protein